MTATVEKKPKAKVLSKADFMKLKPGIKTLEIPELGDVFIKQLTAAEREGLEKKMQEQVEKNGIRATIFIYSVCDENGVLEFSDDDLEMVKGFPVNIVAKVYDFSSEINSLQAKNQEELAKN